MQGTLQYFMNRKQRLGGKEEKKKGEYWKNKKERKNMWKYAFLRNTDTAYISDRLAHI
jgi:hypothetical protein